MRIYVDELPKSCKECFFCEHIEEDIDGKGRDEVACYFEGFLNNVLLGDTFNAKNCKHLQSLADYTKQVRKEVCKNIRTQVESLKTNIFNRYKEYSVVSDFDSNRLRCYEEILEILDQLQGE